MIDSLSKDIRFSGNLSLADLKCLKIYCLPKMLSVLQVVDNIY